MEGVKHWHDPDEPQKRFLVNRTWSQTKMKCQSSSKPRSTFPLKKITVRAMIIISTVQVMIYLAYLFELLYLLWGWFYKSFEKITLVILTRKNPGRKPRFSIFQTAVRSKTWKSTQHTDQMWGTWGTRVFDAFVVIFFPIWGDLHNRAFIRHKEA